MVEFSVEGPGGVVKEDGPLCIAVELVPGRGVEEDGPACIAVESEPDWGNARARCSSTAK